MQITTFFTSNGVPQTGLSPTIDIWRTNDNEHIVNASSMVEIGGGFYGFNFAEYDGTKQYAIRCDGGDTLPSFERYTYAANEGFHEDILSIAANVSAVGETSDSILDLAEDIPSIKDSVVVIDTLVRRILGLSQENYRLFNAVYDEDTGKQLLSCQVRIYGSKSDADDDVDHIAQYSMVATYNENGMMETYKFTKDA